MQGEGKEGDDVQGCSGPGPLLSCWLEGPSPGTATHPPSVQVTAAGKDSPGAAGQVKRSLSLPGAELVWHLLHL